MKRYLLAVVAASCATIVMGQQHSLSNVQLPEMLRNRDRREIHIPDVLGYRTLKCDFHIHTIFSDGTVWPTVRVEEAWTEGLDAIALTEHIESSPKKDYVSTDKNASYHIALPAAKECGLLLIQAGEITRSMPPGHLNALFVDDVNALNLPEPMDAICKAKEKGAFILWNHPGWHAQQPDSCRWMDMHSQIYKEKMMHGIEVFNEKEWYPIALDWCLEKGLAPIANSDIHNVAGYFYDYSHAPRPMTLVLAAERSEASLKEAMLAARTVAFFDNKLAGKAEYLEAIFRASISIDNTGIKGKDGRMRFLMTNHSDIPYELSGSIDRTLLPGATAVVYQNSGKVGVTVKNLWIGSTKNLETQLEFK